MNPIETIRETLECAATADWLPRGMRAKYRDAIDALDTLAGQEAVAYMSASGALFEKRHGAPDMTPLYAAPVVQQQARCPHCDGSGEIETENNGPIGACPVCQPVQQQVDDARSNAVAKIINWAYQRAAEHGFDTTDLTDLVAALSQTKDAGK